MDLRRMRFLINRLPMARFRVEKAMSQATKCTASLTGMPRGGGGESQVERGLDIRLEAKAALKDIHDQLAAIPNCMPCVRRSDPHMPQTRQVNPPVAGNAIPMGSG